jgi:hypothetical protein
MAQEVDAREKSRTDGGWDEIRTTIIGALAA